MLGDLPDLLLVERTRGRDTRAFETLMRRYNRRLYRIARSILTRNDQAEEAVRGAYLRAFANLDRYEPAGKFGAWLARLAFNEALALRRHLATAGSPADKVERPTPTVGSNETALEPGGPGAAEGHTVNSTSSSAALVSSEMASTEMSEQMLELAIDTLPEVFRTVLVLRLIEELSGVEVAVCLGLNETTVRTRLFRAQQRLKVDIARRLREGPANIFELTPERADRIVSQVFARLHTAIPTSEPR
ncbi:MAG TPA: sigma-70 family RNA polymerase sigma factor [Steroidobacteraceae bacterium]|nr:sigma-70 family RNA polymerase sigma factor [Steroidobacteraceae bacterium]